jgi:hypothetical protein
MARKAGSVAGSPDVSGDEREKIAAAAIRPNDAVAKSERDMTLSCWWGVIPSGCRSRASPLLSHGEKRDRQR